MTAYKAVCKQAFVRRMRNVSLKPNGRRRDGGMALSGGQPLAQVSCGSTINQNTTLTADLNNCPGNGVVIGASGITLDLGDHTIDGDGDDVGNGVDNTQGHDQVTIENGRIESLGPG